MTTGIRTRPVNGLGRITAIAKIPSCMRIFIGMVDSLERLLRGYPGIHVPVHGRGEVLELFERFDKIARVAKA